MEDGDMRSIQELCRAVLGFHCPNAADAAANLRAHAETQRLIYHLTREFRSMATEFEDKLAILATDMAAQTTVVTTVQTFIAGLSTQLSDALASAANSGATPAQLAALTDLDTAIKANSAALVAAAQTNIAPERPPIADTTA
jgi:hypothetical protein